jgi:predicted Zn-dependent protease
MMLNEKEAQRIIETILAASSADDVEIAITGEASSNLRFARNSVSTSGTSGNTTLTVSSTFGMKSGSATVNQTDAATLASVVKRAEELAKLAPSDEEYLPPPGPQQYAEVKAYSPETAALSPDARARIAKDCIDEALAREVVAAGFIESGETFSMIANNKGLRASHTATGLRYTVTARTGDGTGSGWGGGGHTDAAKLDGPAVSRRAISKALSSRNPRAVDPGKYTVILEPEAVSNLLDTFGFRLDARSADEGRSYFSDAGGKNKIGQTLFPEFVNISSDPAHPDAPGSPWGEDGLPTARTSWIEHGVLKNLRYSRYWAAKKNVRPLPGPANTIMEGGTGSIEDLIAATERGILITRFWYIRDVDPKTMLLTGLTRDGSFWIENGKIAYPVKNFRFNESPVAMLKNIEMMSKPFRMQNGTSASLIPALKVKEFTFSSLSDAV